jgi:DHA1 family tetracycline resistance protein-like MFS transporter
MERGGGEGAGPGHGHGDAIKSLIAVIASAGGSPLLVMVSHLPKRDWRIGIRFYFCAVLQAAALVLATRHFRRERRARLAAKGA